MRSVGNPLGLDTRSIYDVELEDLPPESSPLDPWLPWLGGLALLLAVVIAVRAILARIRRQTLSPSVDDLRQRIADRSIPFAVCSECLILIELPHAISCPQCSRLDCCVQVLEESERSFALAAVGSQSRA